MKKLLAGFKQEISSLNVEKAKNIAAALTVVLLGTAFAVKIISADVLDFELKVFGLFNVNFYIK